MRPTFISILFMFLFSSLVNATSVKHKELSELVGDADHVIIAKVVKVDMIDKNGDEIVDPEARTGPGSPNLLRLHVEVSKNGILKTNAETELKNLTIPLWQMWHYVLGHWKEAESMTFIFLLKGGKYVKVYPQHFRRPESDLTKIRELLLKAQNKSLKIDSAEKRLTN